MFEKDGCLFETTGEVTLCPGCGTLLFTVKLSFLAFVPGEALRMSGEAGLWVLPECVLLSGAWFVIESFLGVFGVFGKDLEAI